MAERTREGYAGFVRPEGLTLSEAVSSYDQAGVKVAVPEPDSGNAGPMRLNSHGSLSSGVGLGVAGTEVLLQTIRAGHPEPGGAGVVWRNSTLEDWRGGEVPTVIASYASVEPVAGVISATKDSHAITLDDGTVLVAYEATTSSATAPDVVKVRARAASSGAYGTAVDVFGGLLSEELHPCLLLLPSGRILCFYWINDSARDEANVRVSYSDDDGASWAIWQRYALKTVIDTNSTDGYALGRLRAAYSNGQIMLCGHLITKAAAGTYTYADTITQWASDDEGATFDTVGTLDADTNGGGYPEVFALNGRFGMAFISSVDGGKGNYYLGAGAFALLTRYSRTRLISTAEEFGTLAVSGGTTTIDDGDLALCVGDDGTAWIFARQPGELDECLTIRSLDGGESWEAIGSSSNASGTGVWWATGGQGESPNKFSATWQRGRVLLHTNNISAAGGRDDDLDAIALGGHSTLTMPGLTVSARDTSQVSLNYTYLPWHLPGSATIWTKAGAGSESLASQALRLSTSSQQVYYSATPSGTPEQGIIAVFTIQQVSGGVLTATDIGARIRLASSTGTSRGYEVTLRIASTGFRVYDEHAGATIADVSVSMASTVQIRLAMASTDSGGGNTGQLSIWHRLDDTSEDREWEESADSATLNDDGGSGGTSNVLAWGHITSATASSDWTFAGFVSDSYVGEGLAGGQLNPTEVSPIGLSARPVYIDGGAFISAVDGPTVVGDTWTIGQDADYPISDFLIRESPDLRRPWRSASGSPPSAQTLSYDLESGLTAASRNDSTLGCFLGACNWRTGTLYRDSGAGSYSAIASIDLATGYTAIAYSRAGRTVYVNPLGAATNNPTFIDRNILRGATVDLGSSKLRRIASHTEGWLTNAATTRGVIFILEDVDDSEPASGTMVIWRPNVLIAVHSASATSAAGYRLVINSQATVDGYLQGKMLLGPMVLLGDNFEVPEVYEWPAAYETRESADGHERRRRRQPVRQRWALSFSNGIPEHQIRLGNPGTKDYYTNSSSAQGPIAVPGGAARKLAGLIHDLDGGRLPTVFCHHVPRGTPETLHITRSDLVLPCHIEGGVRLEPAQGVTGGYYHERDGMLTRVGTVVLRELPWEP